ncbi:hypothetical protein B0H12DRAFT_1274722 [Mycena haematopus]|nr:hypothetical protein B0H12DRAFT_1274722 [Mycena haematopus]
MTSTNFTIDNINPLIQYAPAGAWIEGSDTEDPLGHDYSNNGTFTLCTTKGSSATFIFNGTQVFVNGAKRSNHGPYSVTLDGTQTLLNGFSEDAVFGPLFVSNVLLQDQHTVTITNQLNNASFPYLDIDFITYTTTIPDNGETKALEDTDPAFTYTPPTSWTTDLSTSQLTGFSGNNGHATTTTGASVTVSFSGTFISLFGPVGPTIARYTVELDGVNAGTFDATKQAYTPQVALFQTSGLEAGQHTLELISQPAISGQILAIDYVQVSPSSTASRADTSGSASGSTALTSASGSPTGSSTPTKSRHVTCVLQVRCPLTPPSSSVGPAIGGAVGGAVVLAILIFHIFLVCRRKRRREQDPTQMPFENKYTRRPAPYTVGMSSSTMIPHTASITTPSKYLASSHVHSSSSVSQSGSGSHASVGLSSTVHSAGAAGLGAGGGNARGNKGRPPPTANVPLPADAPRMYVPGRERDMGPLPPDYEQATEPYHPS